MLHPGVPARPVPTIVSKINSGFAKPTSCDGSSMSGPPDPMHGRPDVRRRWNVHDRSDDKPQELLEIEIPRRVLPHRMRNILAHRRIHGVEVLARVHPGQEAVPPIGRRGRGQLVEVGGVDQRLITPRASLHHQLTQSGHVSRPDCQSENQTRSQRTTDASRLGRVRLHAERATRSQRHGDLYKIFR